MDWTDALDLVISRTQHQAYRRACDESHPKHEMWRRRMIEMAGGELPPEPASGPPRYPSLIAMAGNALDALGRVVAAVATSRPVIVSDEEKGRRLGICRGCEHFIAKDERCSKCGCNMPWKTRISSEHCPINLW